MLYPYKVYFPAEHLEEIYELAKVTCQVKFVGTRLGRLIVRLDILPKSKIVVG